MTGLFLCMMHSLFFVLSDPQTLHLELYREDECTAHATLQRETRINLLLEIAAFLEQEGVTPEELDNILFVNRGTFTTVRAACLVANTFAEELGVTLVPIAEPVTSGSAYLAEPGVSHVEAHFGAPPRMG